MLHYSISVTSGGGYWARRALACPLFAPCARPYFAQKSGFSKLECNDSENSEKKSAYKVCPSAPKYLWQTEN